MILKNRNILWFKSIFPISFPLASCFRSAIKSRKNAFIYQVKSGGRISVFGLFEHDTPARASPSATRYRSGVIISSFQYLTSDSFRFMLATAAHFLQDGSRAEIGVNRGLKSLPFSIEDSPTIINSPSPSTKHTAF